MEIGWENSGCFHSVLDGYRAGKLSIYLWCIYNVLGQNTGVCPQCVLLRPSQSFARELLEPIRSPLTQTLHDLPQPLKLRLLGEYCVHLAPPPRFAALIVLWGLEEQVGKPLVLGVRSTRPTWILDNLPEYATSTERSIPTERDIATATTILRH